VNKGDFGAEFSKTGAAREVLRVRGPAASHPSRLPPPSTMQGDSDVGELCCEKQN